MIYIPCIGYSITSSKPPLWHPPPISLTSTSTLVVRPPPSNKHINIGASLPSSNDDAAAATATADATAFIVLLVV